MSTREYVQLIRHRPSAAPTWPLTDQKTDLFIALRTAVRGLTRVGTHRAPTGYSRGTQQRTYRGTHQHEVLTGYSRKLNRALSRVPITYSLG